MTFRSWMLCAALCSAACFRTATPTPAPQESAAPSTVQDTPPTATQPQRAVLPRRLPNPPPQRTMRLHMLDVGQGSALLVEFPCAAMLVDTGGELNDQFDGVGAFRDQLNAFFERRKDLNRTLALVVITHPHVDHMKGVPVLLDGFTVTHWVDNGQHGDELVAEAMSAVDTLVQRGTLRHSVQAEDIVAGGFTNGDVDPVACAQVDPQVRMLWGGLRYDPGWPLERERSPFLNENNHSVVVRIDFGETSVLVTGDLETVALQDLVRRHQDTRVLDVDIYVAGHHGSGNGTTRELMQQVRPKLALMSMGPASRHESWTAYQYGHPREAAVEAMRQAVMLGRPLVQVPVGMGMKRFFDLPLSEAVFATGWDGAVTVESDAEGHLAVDAARWRKPRKKP